MYYIHFHTFPQQIFNNNLFVDYVAVSLQLVLVFKLMPFLLVRRVKLKFQNKMYMEESVALALFFIIISATTVTFRSLDAMHCTMLNYNTIICSINNFLTENVLAVQ